MCPSSGVVSVVIVTLLLTSISSGHQQDDEPGLDVFLPDAPLVVKQFYQTIESAINHLVVSRDMHRAVRRHKRQLGGLLGGGGGGGGGGPLGSLFQGDFLDGLTNLAQLGSLNGLTAVPDDLGPVAPILQGIGNANTVVRQVTELDRMKCSQRLACEFMANRGVFNRTSNLLPTSAIPLLPNNTRNAFNLSHPSTFRTILGVLQLMRVHEFGAYPHLEAGLWGAAHRDNSRCRTQFANCPSTSEAFINELNNAPGGVQGMLTQAIQTLRPIFPSGGGGASDLVDAAGGLFGAPQTAASTADLAGGLTSLGQTQAGGLGGLLGSGGQLGASSINSLLQGAQGLAGLGSNNFDSNTLAGLGQQGGQFGGLGGNRFTPEQLAAAGITNSGNGLGQLGGNHQFTPAQLAAAGITGNHQFTPAQLAAAGITGNQFLGGAGGNHQFTPAQLAATGISGNQFAGAGQFGGNQFTATQLAGAGLGGGQFGGSQFAGQLGNQFTSAQLGGAGLGGNQFAGHQFTPAQLAAAGIGANQFGGQLGGLGGSQFATGQHQFTAAQLAGAGLSGNQFATGQFAGFGAGNQFTAGQLAGLGASQFSNPAQFGNQFAAGQLAGTQFAGQGFQQPSQGLGGFGGLVSNFLKSAVVPQQPNKKSESKPKWSWG